MTERGQAIVLAILVLGIAAAATVGLREAQSRLVDRVRTDRAAEAAVEAAGAVLADNLMLGRDPSELTVDAGALRAAGEAATEAAFANGRPAPTGLHVSRAPAGLLVELTLSGRRQRVEVPWPCCRR